MEASDAAATSRRLARTSRHIALLFLPDREGFGEGAVPRQTLFCGQDGSAAIDVADWDVEPRTFLEHLNIALLVSTGSRKLDYKNTICRPGSDLSERSTRLLRGSFHQNSRHAGHAATRKIYRQIKYHFDGVAGRQGVVDVSGTGPPPGLRALIVQCPGDGLCPSPKGSVCVHGVVVVTNSAGTCWMLGEGGDSEIVWPHPVSGALLMLVT